MQIILIMIDVMCQQQLFPISVYVKKHPSPQIDLKRLINWLDNFYFFVFTRTWLFKGIPNFRNMVSSDECIIAAALLERQQFWY